MTWVSRGGFTLIEVMVVLVILGLIAGVAGAAIAGLREPRATAWIREARATRDSAIRAGVAVSVTVSLPGAVGNHATRATRLVFLPDGRALGTGVDPLTGGPR